jgi:hypothetical protein
MEQAESAQCVALRAISQHVLHQLRIAINFASTVHAHRHTDKHRTNAAPPNAPCNHTPRSQSKNAITRAHRPRSQVECVQHARHQFVSVLRTA